MSSAQPPRIEKGLGGPLLAGVAALTALAFALRVAGIDQTIFGDELTLYNIVQHGFGYGQVPDGRGNGLGQVLAVVKETEKTPPLGFVLTWASGHIGDPTVTTRLPSVLLGTATVPLVYLVGIRTVGRAAAMAGAAILALAPFALYYSVENRAYAALAFFSVLSTLALLTALRRDGLLPWLAYGVSAAAVLYTHYTGVFVVLAQFGWALWARPDLRGRVLLVHAGVLVALLPWLPGFLTQLDHSDAETTRLAKTFPLTLHTLSRLATGVLPGDPLGSAPEIAVWGAIAAGIVAVVVGTRRAAAAPAERGRVALIVLLTVATPIGLIAYSLQPDTSLLLSRNASASVPAFALLVGWLLTSLPRPLAAVALSVVLAALVVGAARTLDADYQRPAFREAARYIDDVAGARDPVLASEPGYLGLYLKRSHPIASVEDPDAWRAAARGGRVWVVRLKVSPELGIPPAGGADQMVPRRSEREFPGRFPVAVGAFSGRIQGSLVRDAAGSRIDWSRGRAVVVPKAVDGVVDRVGDAEAGLHLVGWAVDAENAIAAESVLAFRGSRLVARGRVGARRPDVAKGHGPGSITSGYEITLPGIPTRDVLSGRVSVYGVAGGRASRLELTPEGRKAARESS